MPNRPDKVPAPKRIQASSTARGYDAKHRRDREQLLRERPICEVCGVRWSVQAHHLRYPATSLADYQAVCVPCHNRITKGR